MTCTFQEALWAPGRGCWSFPLSCQYCGQRPAVPAVHSGGHLPEPVCSCYQMVEKRLALKRASHCQADLLMSSGCWMM